MAADEIADHRVYKKTAEYFFELLKRKHVRRLVDIRLNNVSQLAGFAKKKDLEYFLGSICQIDYIHEPLLAPTQDILDDYKKHQGSWEDYEQRFLDLMAERRIESLLDPEIFQDACVLCSEDKPRHCHRRLVAEYLKRHWDDVEIEHLT